MLPSLRKFTNSEIAGERMKIIKFYDEFGEKAAREAFGADRKVVSRWRQRLDKSGGKLSSLVPCSTKPLSVRKPLTDFRIIEWIKEQREAHPRIGKEKLAPDLDEYCRSIRIHSVSVSTIGNIIKRHNLYYQKPNYRIYHDPNSAWAKKAVKKEKRLRIRHSPRPQEYGHILSDTVEKVISGVKRYFMSAVDAKLKFALTLEYPRITSANMKDFYLRFKKVYPGKIRIWQSDNGSENLGVFDQQLKEDGIPHYFIYPRCPQVDTFIERYNRTVQEECLDYHLDKLIDFKQGNEVLTDWNIYYNTKRRHHSLGLKSPINYLIDNGGMSQMSLTYTKSVQVQIDPVHIWRYERYNRQPYGVQRIYCSQRKEIKPPFSE
jgi:transposase InsO family protein